MPSCVAGVAEMILGFVYHYHSNIVIEVSRDVTLIAFSAFQHVKVNLVTISKSPDLLVRLQWLCHARFRGMFGNSCSA